MEARIYYYGKPKTYTVEFNGHARPTPKEKVLAFCEKAVQQEISIIIDMSYRGINNADLELSDELRARGVDHQIVE